MSYIPSNVAVYMRSYTGCLAGLGAAGKFLTDSASADYQPYARMADAFAQQVDATWVAVGRGTPTSFEAAALEDNSAAVWQGRSPLPASTAFVPANYSSLASAVIALVIAGDAQLAAEGIVVPAGGLTPQPAALQGTQIIDPQNATGVASTSGSTTATVTDSGGTPRTGRVWSTYAALAAAWGTTSPAINVPLIIVQCSSHTDGSDPVDLTPISITNGAGCAYVATAPTVTRTDTLASTVALKRTATSNMLQTDLNAATAGSTRLKNTTHSSIAWSYVKVSGALFGITLPCVPSVVPATGGDPTEVATWADGDTVQELQAIKVNLARVGITLLTGSAGTGFCATGFDVLDPIGGGASGLAVDAEAGFCVFDEVRFERFVSQQAMAAWGVEYINCCFVSGADLTGASTVEAGMVSLAAFQFSINAINQVLLPGAQINFDFVIGAAHPGSVILNGVIAIGTMCIDTLIFFTGGIASLQATIFGTNLVYSAGSGVSNNATATINMQGTSRMAIITGDTAVNALTYAAAVATGVQLNGAALGFSWDGATLRSGIATTPAHIDAAAGATGFGGNAFNLGGASVSTVAN